MQLHNEGITINHKTVERLMKEQGLRCLIRKKRYRSYRGTIGNIAPNILDRDFKAAKPYQKLVTDVSQIAIGDKKSFLSPVLDLFNGEVLGYDISDRADLSQINNMLDEVFAITDKLPEDWGTILHSDQGWQYQHKSYQDANQEHLCWIWAENGVRQPRILLYGEKLEVVSPQSLREQIKTTLKKQIERYLGTQ